MARQKAAATGLALITVGLMVSVGFVSAKQTDAWASSPDPCVASATLSDAVTKGDESASGLPGSINNPWIISTAGELTKLSELASLTVDTYRKGHFRQTSDINLGGCLFTPIGVKTTAGGWTSGIGEIVQVVDFHYDGRGHRITGLRVDRNGYGGLFTRFNSGSVKNLGLVDVNIKATTPVGGLIAELRSCKPSPSNAIASVVSNVFVTGAVEGTSNVGGIAGVMGDVCGRVAQVLNSYTNVAVTGGNNPTGGLGGRAASATTVIVNSYASGQLAQSGLESVTSGRFGGLLGALDPPVVPDTQNSFWDTVNSSLATSNGGTGKTSLELQAFETFDTASPRWAIVDGWEAYNFASPTNTWGICSQVNDGYPFLLWEHTTDPCVSTPTPEPSAPSTSSGSPISVPSAGVAEVSLGAGSLVNQTLVRIRLTKTPTSYEQFFIVVRLLDLRGELIREVRVPVEPSTSSVQIPVDKKIGQFNVVALTSNAAGATAAVSLNPQTVKQSNIRKASETAPKRLTGKSLNRDVVFTADSAALSPQMKRTLRQAARLAKASDSRVAVTGFAATSPRGTKFEKTLAERRALRVANFLRNQGIENWIYYHGLNSRQGSDFPGQPRRVEIRVLK